MIKTHFDGKTFLIICFATKLLGFQFNYERTTLVD